MYGYYLGKIIYKNWKKYRDIFDQILPSLVGVSMFVGTLTLATITILDSRGLYYMGGDTNFTMVIPIAKLVQKILQSILNLKLKNKKGKRGYGLDIFPYRLV